MPGGISRSFGPLFDKAVPDGGYSWWYVDALSEDGTQGLTIIAFIGSVFSPYYALARARGRGDATNHVAMNVALYGKPSRWAMTERGRGSLRQSESDLVIGPSAMHWDGTRLTISLDEVTCPLPSRLRGTVVVTPRGLNDRAFTLDQAGRHRWQPLAPLSDVVVDFESPSLRYRGTGYFDTNDGDEPLEAAFRSWTWSRFDLGDRARIFYDVIEKDGLARSLSLDVAESGTVAFGPSTPYQSLPRGLWGVERPAPGDLGHRPALLESLEDAPFYTRSKIRSRIEGVDAIGINESLSLRRLQASWVRMMLPFRMPRWTS